MRLAQLARELKITTADATEYLAKKASIEVDGPNMKLEEESIQLLRDRYEKKPKTEDVASEDGDQKVEETEIEVITVSEEKKEEDTQDSPEAENQEPDDIAVDMDAELVSADKVSLAGLKIVDKIDLPEPPPSAPIEIDGVMYTKEELDAKRKAEREEKVKKRESRRAAQAKKKDFQRADYNEDFSQEKKKLKEEKDRERQKEKNEEKERKEH